jgi:hypothetical protein
VLVLVLVLVFVSGRQPGGDRGLDDPGAIRDRGFRRTGLIGGDLFALAGIIGSARPGS